MHRLLSEGVVVTETGCAGEVEVAGKNLWCAGLAPIFLYGG